MQITKIAIKHFRVKSTKTLYLDHQKRLMTSQTVLSQGLPKYASSFIFLIYSGTFQSIQKGDRGAEAR